MARRVLFLRSALLGELESSRDARIEELRRPRSHRESDPRGTPGRRFRRTEQLPLEDGRVRRRRDVRGGRGGHGQPPEPTRGRLRSSRLSHGSRSSSPPLAGKGAAQVLAERPDLWLV